MLVREAMIWGELYLKSVADVGPEVGESEGERGSGDTAVHGVEQVLLWDGGVQGGEGAVLAGGVRGQGTARHHSDSGDESRGDDHIQDEGGAWGVPIASQLGSSRSWSNSQWDQSQTV